MIVTILISLLFLIIFGFLFIGCYSKKINCIKVLILLLILVRSKKLYGKLKKKYGQNGDISDKELDHLRSLTYCEALKDNILYTWK